MLRLRTNLRITGLRLADMVMEGTFFLLQVYLTDVWKFNFTTAAAILNIWGGIYRILPIFFLVVADTFVGNFVTLTFSGISSTTGLVLITVSALPVYRCDMKEKAQCVGHKEKGLFVVGMALIALGRAARFASAQPFIEEQEEQKEEEEQEEQKEEERQAASNLIISILILTSIAVNFTFPYAKKWYLLFGVSTMYTASATVFFLSGYRRYKRPGPKPDGSPIIDIFRVFVAAAFKISHPIPRDKTQLHQNDQIEEEFTEFSPSGVLRFLHKAAIKLPGEEEANKKSWRLCSVSQVESTKAVIRMVPMWSGLIMCGVASSTGSTFFIEQLSHMKYKIGAWDPPAQLLLLFYVMVTIMAGEDPDGFMVGSPQISEFSLPSSYGNSFVATLYSIVCFSVGAAVERRRLHVGARHHLLDQPDAKIPLNAGWLFFQVFFLTIVEAFFVLSLTAYHKEKAPRSMRGLQNIIIEGVSGVGFICSALLVYVVGKISERGGNNNWFQNSLNMSRLDRYYWVLAALFGVNHIPYLMIYVVHVFMKIQEEEEQRRIGRHPLTSRSILYMLLLRTKN